MRCALCGGEIDSRTKQCVKCGECWGGGNRGVAQEVSKELETPYSPPKPTFLQNCISSLRNMLSPLDKLLVDCAGKASAVFKKKTTVHQNRTIAYSFLLAGLIILIIVPTICCTSCTANGLQGKWIAADSSGSVSIEFSGDSDVTMYVLSGNEEKIYRTGTFSTDGSLLKIRYDDGESITLTYSVNKDTVVFTSLSTGQSQSYIRK